MLLNLKKICLAGVRFGSDIYSLMNRSAIIIIIIIIITPTTTAGERGGIMVKAVRYKLGGRGFDSRWCHSNFSVT